MDITYYDVIEEGIVSNFFFCLLIMGGEKGGSFSSEKEKDSPFGGMKNWVKAPLEQKPVAKALSMPCAGGGSFWLGRPKKNQKARLT